MGKVNMLNRRKDDRYFIEEIPIPGMGGIVEVCRNGLKIRKTAGSGMRGNIVSVNIAEHEIKTAVRWEDNLFIGIQVEQPFTDPAFIIKRVIRPKETLAPPQMAVSEKAILHYTQDEVLTSMIALLMEIESTEPNIAKIGTCIEDICSLKDKEDTPENGNKERQDTEKERSCKDELIAKAVSLHGHDDAEVKDVNFAITRLGLDHVREIIRDHVHKRIFQSQTALTAFKNFETYTILKSTVFKNLCRHFGLSYLQPEGNALLSFETAGFEILIKESSGVLDDYYTSSSRLYAEVSRSFEKAFFGVDPLTINKHYFEKNIGAFRELYNGYILANCALNPHYSPAEELKLSMAKNGLLFSFLAYLTFLAINFLMDKDRESGFVLKKKLMHKGMRDNMVSNLLDTAVSEAKAILKDFSAKGSIIRPSLPEGSYSLDRYLGKDIRFEYLQKSFAAFDRLNTARMALRYEDASYAHFILGRILNSDSLALNARTLCVVPCRNASLDQWYIRDFAYFDLIVFKDVHKLPPVHLSAFLKLWDTFEGQIIVTFSNLAFLDYTRPPLHSSLKSAIVDVPSYISNESIYKKMVDTTLDYLQPYMGDQKIDAGAYFKDVYSMKHIKTDIILTRGIV